MTKISVVVPTIRPDSMKEWLSRWEALLHKHNAELFIVFDGQDQHVLRPCRDATGSYRWMRWYVPQGINRKEAICEAGDLFCQYCSSCKNLGLFAVAKYRPDTDVIIVLDDDCYPLPTNNDPIQEHLDALDQRTVTSWTDVGLFRTRGFPYAIREEAEVVFSHGIWENVPDIDAPTSLLDKSRFISKRSDFSKGVITKGSYFPCSGMNVAFKTKILPYVYWAPVGNFNGAKRFDDIWMGIHLVRELALQEPSLAICTGWSAIWHERASNVWKNLEQEAIGLRINETYWKDDFVPEPEHKAWFKEYDKKRKQWKDVITKLLGNVAI